MCRASTLRGRPVSGLAPRQRSAQSARHAVKHAHQGGHGQPNVADAQGLLAGLQHLQQRAKAAYRGHGQLVHLDALPSFSHAPPSGI